jgi:GNAT superfamily N-acetyltransferase
MNAITPPGIIIRHAEKDDLQGIAELIIQADIAESGESDFTLDDLMSDQGRPGFHLEKDAWVAVTADGPAGENGSGRQKIVGYEEVWNRSEHAILQGDGYVHPDYTGMGIGTALLQTMETRARQHVRYAPKGKQVVIRNGTSGNDKAASRLHEAEGYLPARYFWRMEIEMDAAPPDPVFPPGIGLIPYQTSLVRPVFDALEEAFRDHWGYIPWNFQEWKRRRFADGEFYPDLWFIAADLGEAGVNGAADPGKADLSRMQIAGAAICWIKSSGGWVGTLGVRRPWRRSGLGLALLHHAFGEFYRRGHRRVGLGVDASNPTGATRLYERAGMHVAHEYILFEKELRPGQESLELVQEANMA